MKFTVPITRDTTETTMVDVEAATALEARDKALLEVQQYPERFEFTPDDCTGGEPYFAGDDDLESIEEDEAELLDKADQKHNAQMLDGCETDEERNAELRHQTHGR